MHNMSSDVIRAFRAWFADYTDSFATGSIEDQKNITLKVVHTYEVCRNARAIAHEILSGNNIFLAEAAALFHDIGRFQQYARFKTFDDRVSVNHGRLGAEILENEKLLNDLSLEEQEIIVESVRFHNAFSLPSLRNPLTMQILRLIRDADKLDIWRVFIEYFRQSKEERASAAGVGLPDVPECSDEVIACFLSGKMIPISMAATLNDYKLVQLSWIFDLQLNSTFRLLAERNIIDRLCETLPRTDNIQLLISVIKEYASSKSREQ
jgi:putative nucleotidyltransferase with HDIG domain